MLHLAIVDARYDTTPRFGTQLRLGMSLSPLMRSGRKPAILKSKAAREKTWQTYGRAPQPTRPTYSPNKHRTSIARISGCSYQLPSVASARHKRKALRQSRAAMCPSSNAVVINQCIL